MLNELKHQVCSVLTKTLPKLIFFLRNCSYHIPEIRVVTVEPLRAGTVCELILKFINPTQHQTTIKFLPLSFEEPDISVNTEEKVVSLDTNEQPSNITEVRLLI